MKQGLTFVAVISIISFLFGTFNYNCLIQKARAATPTITERQVTSNIESQKDPVIGDNYVVWVDSRDGNNDIYAADINDPINIVEIKLINEDSSQDSPSVDGDNLVWRDNRNGNNDIYFCTLPNCSETERRITTNSSSQSSPDISGDIIIWEDRRSGKLDIGIYNLETSEESILSVQSNYYYMFPRIDNNLITWADNNSGNLDIYIYNLDSEITTQVTDEAGSQYDPDVSNNKIVWIDYRDSAINADVWMYDILTDEETQITDDNYEADQCFVKINNNIIVWRDSRNGNSDIYAFDLDCGCEFQITDEEAEQTRPSVNNNIIVWDDLRDDLGGATDYNIYLATLTYPPDPTPTPAAGSQSRASAIVFENLPEGSMPINLEEGQSVEGIINLQIKPYSKAGILKVEFYVDDNLLCIVDSPDANGVYSCDWDTSQFHSLVKIIVFDKTGNSETLTRQVTVLGQDSTDSGTADQATVLPQTGADLSIYN